MKKRTKQNLSLADIFRQAKTIHVFEKNDGVRILCMSEYDKTRGVKPFSEHFVEGSGTRKNPYCYTSAAPISPYFSIIDLWLKFRENAARKHRPIFIEANDYILQVTFDGVTAKDGCFTRLLPPTDSLEN